MFQLSGGGSVFIRRSAWVQFEWGPPIKNVPVIKLHTSVTNIIIIKTSSKSPSGKNNFFINRFATPQAHVPRKTEKQTQESNQRLTDPLNQFNVPVSNTM